MFEACWEMLHFGKVFKKIKILHYELYFKDKVMPNNVYVIKGNGKFDKRYADDLKEKLYQSIGLAVDVVYEMALVFASVDVILNTYESLLKPAFPLVLSDGDNKRVEFNDWESEPTYGIDCISNVVTTSDLFKTSKVKLMLFQYLKIMLQKKIP